MASNSTAKNEKQGFFSKMSSSFSGIIIGFLLLIGGIFMLWTNEQKNVKNIKNVKELRDQVVDVSSTSVEDKYEGKLIATSGILEYNDAEIKDENFNVSVKTPTLKRIVEVYQWNEISAEEEGKDPTYEKIWSEKIIDSSEFTKKDGHSNPIEESIPYESKEYYTEETLTVGKYILSSGFKKLLPANKNVGIEDGIELPEGYKLYNNKYITNSEDPENPIVGNIRISFKKNNYKEVSVLGKQSGDTITEYTTKKNTNILRLAEGETNGTGLINNIESANNMTKWLSRICGTILIIIAVGSILGPITTLIGYIPFLGKIVNSMIGVVSFLIGLSISLVIIAIAWFAARPIVSIVLIVIIAGLIAGLIYYKKNKTISEEKTN